MTLRVDLDAKAIRASVTALAEREDVLPRPASPMAFARTMLGSSIHGTWRARREQDDEAFQGEVDLRLALEVEGFQVKVRGRADGVTDLGTGLLVEELKSVEAEGAAFSALGLKDLAVAARQVRLYALALAERGRPVRARLELVSITDGRTRELDVPFRPARVRASLEARLRRAIEAARARREQARARKEVAERLRFPFQSMREGQASLIETVMEGLDAGRPVLVEAPTGLGKTVCAMLPALQFALRHDARLFFLTAKGTQQALVAETFEALRLAAGEPDLRALTLRPKAEQCPPSHQVCHPEVCDWLARFLEKKPREAALVPLRTTPGHVDPASIREAGDEHHVCPYALSLQLLDRADVVIGDVNYVYDPAVRLAPLLDEGAGRPAVVVVDEAHNLFDRAREHESAFLGEKRLAAFAREAGKVRPDPPDDTPLFASLGGGERDFAGALTRFAKALSRHVLECQSAALAGQADALDGTRALVHDPDAWSGLVQEAARLLLIWSVRRGRVPRGDDPVGEALRTVLSLGDLHARTNPSTHLPYVRAGADGGVGMLCLDPAPRLASLHALHLGSVLMSATLSPLDDQARRLGLAGLAPLEARLPSPFPFENRCVLIVPDVSTTWRDRSRHFEGIARHIDDVVAVREGRYAACFPSYAFLEAVRERLDAGASQHFVQAPRMAESARQGLLERFRRSPGSSLLLVVMGGVFTEGIDLPGDALVGAIIVGPALPQIGFERAALRRRIDDLGEDGFASTMLYPGMRRVVQAAGRVHRTPDDCGVIVLLGQRFAREPWIGLLPDHWWRYGPEPAITSTPTEALQRFWEVSARPTAR